MKPSWGVGVLVAILLSVAVYLLGIVGVSGLVSLALLLAGLWTLAAAFVIEEREDRNFFAGWGIIITGLSFSYALPLQYALALILIAIVVLILVTTYFGKTSGVHPAATPPPSPGGGAPAATAI